MNVQICIVESEIHMVQALEDIKKAGCNALLCISWKLLDLKFLKHFLQSILTDLKMFVAAAEGDTETI
ncbi:MAG: hypothetical protein ACLU3F_05150 [Blautia wexlerae]